MVSNSIEVFVFAAPGRESHAATFASIEQSDIGKDYVVCENPPGVGAREHWQATHERAAKSKAGHVLVLEDDVWVNQNILHNCRTWRWRNHHQFGAGWLLKPGGWRGREDCWYPLHEWACTQGVLYRTSLLPSFVGLALMFMAQGDPWDSAVSHAVYDTGHRIRSHGPSLVEHNQLVPSLLGTPASRQRSAGATFDPGWRRQPGDPNWG